MRFEAQVAEHGDDRIPDLRRAVASLRGCIAVPSLAPFSEPPIFGAMTGPAQRDHIVGPTFDVGMMPRQR